jgi:hypothetical protein
MSRVALANRLKQIEASRLIQATVIHIKGGLPEQDAFPSRATIVDTHGTISSHHRHPTESLPLFLSRLQTSFNPTCVALGGLPRLPGTTISGF